MVGRNVVGGHAMCNIFAFHYSRQILWNPLEVLQCEKELTLEKKGKRRQKKVNLNE